MNDLQKMLKNMVVMFISSYTTIEEATIDDKIDEVSGMPTFSSLSTEEIEEVKASIKSEFSIKLDRGVLIEEKNHEKWFLARKAQLSMKYWERYKKYLLADKGFSTKVVNTMDDILDTLTDLLGDPERDIKYKRRGLIIGDVQSGKTANYTGLICKAVDSGYKVTYEIVPIKPGKGEYYVYVDDKNNEKQPIFSNDQSKHKDAVIGHDINEDNVKEVIKKIEEIRA